MIQRIQSVYIAIAALAVALTFFIPFSNYTIFEENVEFNAAGIGIQKGDVTFFPIVFNVAISVLLAFFAIISFKKRKRQLLLNTFNYLTIIVLIVLVFLNFTKVESSFGLKEENIHYAFGMFLPIISLVTLFMANRSIKSDEKLIKSMDRIR